MSSDDSVTAKLSSLKSNSLSGMGCGGKGLRSIFLGDDNDVEGSDGTGVLPSALSSSSRRLKVVGRGSILIGDDDRGDARGDVVVMATDEIVLGRACASPCGLCSC